MFVGIVFQFASPFLYGNPLLRAYPVKLDWRFKDPKWRVKQKLYPSFVTPVASIFNHNKGG